MRLTGHEVLKFDSFLPMYNWIYPLGGRLSQNYREDNGSEVFRALQPSKGRALYLHIPFCETICTFCPFVRGKFHDRSAIDTYVRALLREIALKAEYPALTEVPIRAIFVGGGTPSLLDPSHILQIGQALREHFDLSQIREFSFEFEVKSVTPERVAALLEIGVTHARFGLQTFSAEYRDFFGLTASVDQVRAASALLRQSFQHASCDLLYGMNGQTEEELFADLEAVCALGLNNIDAYPINNLATQRNLHRAFRRADRPPTSGLTKFYMTLFVREVLRQNGYLPHNGHGYVKVPQQEIDRDPVVTDTYSFVYHEHVFGYPGYDLLGFGTNAVSSFAGFTVFNPASRTAYLQALEDRRLPVRVAEHGDILDFCRPLALALPYHGSIPAEFVNWGQIPGPILERIQELEAHKLILVNSSEIQLTRQGWEWYSSIMYYLLPHEEQRAIQAIIRRGRQDRERWIETPGLEGFPFDGSTSAALA